MEHYCDNCNDKDMEIIDLKKEHEVQIRKLSKFETERVIKLKKEHEKEIEDLTTIEHECIFCIDKM